LVPACNYPVFEIPNDLTMFHQHGGHYSVNSMRGWLRTADWNGEKLRWYISRRPSICPGRQTRLTHTGTADLSNTRQNHYRLVVYSCLCYECVFYFPYA